MPTHYKAPVDDYVFLLHDAFRDETAAVMGDVSRDDTRQILEQAARFFEEQWAPLDAPGDEVGCKFENGVVKTPPGYKAGYAAMIEGGWNSVSAPSEFGGADLPDLVGQAIREFSASACNSLGLYSGLTIGAHATIRKTGDDWMRLHIVPKMVQGAWAGTMCLTEPHCGTDLRLMKTRAVPQPDGSWCLTGTKIFISGGDQDLTENVIHLVLAKVPDENGRFVDDLSTVSLFLVCKLAVDPQTGDIGANNGVTVAGIEHKMGLKGSATCTMAFDDSVAFRLGESKSATGQQRKSSAGMSGMFDMMNSARLGTGLQAMSSASRAYDHAAQYARERVAGRAAKAQDRSGGPADPIMVHPDVRRLLLKQASFVEGARALGLYVRTLLDDMSPIAGVPRSVVGSFLTPVVKAFFSDRASESVNDAMQLMGGHGYIRENGIEQLVRDCRIFQLYEGANGVQALDLASRKLQSGAGKALPALLELALLDADKAAQHDALRPYSEELRKATEQVQAAAMWLSSPERDPYDIGGSSYDFLNMVGILAIAMVWLRQAVTAQTGIATSENVPFLERKLVLARYWFEYELPMMQALLTRVGKSAEGLMQLPAEQF